MLLLTPLGLFFLSFFLRRRRLLPYLQCTEKRISQTNGPQFFYVFGLNRSESRVGTKLGSLK